MKSILQKRTISFMVIAIIYAAAVAVGVAVYRLLPHPFWLNLLIADTAATVFVFIFSLLFKNASVYDPYWSVQPPVILIAYALQNGMAPARWLLLIAVGFWGIRLTANWAYTFQGMEHQDWRYTMLREQTGIFYSIINFLGIHMVPTIVVYGCILPAVFIYEAEPVWNPFCIPFFVLSLGAAVLQGAADWQMQRYRQNRSGNFIRSGLWKYARHPNYLGELLIWWGVALFALILLPGRWYLCIGAAANTLLFFCVSIPMAEKRQSRKEGYEAYKKATRLLLPIRK